MIRRSNEAADGAERDTETIRLLASDDPDGLRRMLLDHGGCLRDQLRHDFGQVFDASTLDEVMSLATIRAWTHRRRFDPRLGTLRAWLMVIARHCALRLLRSRRRPGLRFLSEMDEPPEPLSHDEEPGAERLPLLADLHTGIFRLSDLRRAVILADIEAGGTAPAAEIARRLNTTISSVYQARRQARVQLVQDLLARGHRLDGVNAEFPDTPEREVDHA